MSSNDRSERRQLPVLQDIGAKMSRPAIIPAGPWPRRMCAAVAAGCFTDRDWVS
jgi:hypothetical protein